MVEFAQVSRDLPPRAVEEMYIVTNSTSIEDMRAR
jgi:hypothetical protein